ncbi:hypothetical protein PMAC_001550 [Pneumocystis sp. 'macacae']|nr:hypothetical protein PMAC_001550 [Pneumocystis sp. 'macacae']
MDVIELNVDSDEMTRPSLIKKDVSGLKTRLSRTGRQVKQLPHPRFLTTLL